MLTIATDITEVGRDQNKSDLYFDRMKVSTRTGGNAVFTQNSFLLQSVGQVSDVVRSQEKNV